MRERILIAVPTLDGRVSMSLAYLFAAAEQKNFIVGCPYKFSMRIFQGIRGYAAVRNTIAQYFLRQDADRLWMIDDDIMPETSILSLPDVDADIVAPIMPSTRIVVNENDRKIDFSFTVIAYDFQDIKDVNTVMQLNTPKPEVTDVDAVGFGCTIIKRKLLEDERLRGETSFTRSDGTTHEMPEDSPPPIFNMKIMPNGITELGEDVDFCYRAGRLGYSVKLDGRHLVGHQKTVNARDLYLIRKFYDAQASQPTVANAIQ
jgi:hypothetical protein